MPILAPQRRTLRLAASLLALALPALAPSIASAWSGGLMPVNQNIHIENVASAKCLDEDANSRHMNGTRGPALGL